MTRDATGLAVDRAELLISARAIEARRLDAQCIHIRSDGPKAYRFVFNGLDQRLAMTLAAEFLLQPEQLDEQHGGPNFSDDAAYDFIIGKQRDSEALVFL